MNFEKWEKKYKPIKNHITENLMDGLGFESYGEELKFIQKQDIKNIWTVIHGDGCECENNGDRNELEGCADYCEGEIWLIYNGMGIVNRVCYLITEIPEEKEALSITVEY
tara:strand:- start:1146 stop:1475 length:330 start_codon:yes stop_codon:yes gene_type:complete